MALPGVNPTWLNASDRAESSSAKASCNAGAREVSPTQQDCETTIKLQELVTRIGARIDRSAPALSGAAPTMLARSKIALIASSSAPTASSNSARS